MSKLSEMIARLCPNGVEYKKLGEVAEIGTGSSNRNEAVEDGLYPFFVRSQTVERMNKFEFDEEAIIIPGEGGIGDIFHHVNGKYALHQRVYRIHFVTSSLDTRFAYYYLTAYFKKFILGKAVTATVTSIRKPMIENFSIPLPPLPIQREIVQILDNFANLTAELTAELAKRKKQYEHYRDMLLNFEGGGRYDKFGIESGEFRVEWKRLGEIIEGGIINMTRGDYITKKDAKPGEIPVILGGQEPAYFINRFNHDGKAIVISRSGASAGFVSYWNEPIFVTDGFAFDCDESRLNTRYLFHWMKNNQARLNGMKKGGGVPHITGENLKSLEFPLPPLAEQKRIVAILDRFDALCNSLTEGLPAEIALRKKQYEYYRDKLLSFKEAS